MRSFALASGSSGNCFYVETEDNKILVDLGLTFSRTKSILDEKGVDVNEIRGVFITHEHADHVAGLKVFAKNVRCQFFMSQGTYEMIKKDLKGVDIKIVKHHDNFSLGDLRVFAVEKSHDAKEALSFVFENKGKKLGVFTDLGEVSNEIKHILKDLDIIYFEANYCKDYVNKNCKDMNWNYLNRLMSSSGHLGVHQSLEVLQEVVNNSQRIVLSHISENTNFYENVYRQIKEALLAVEKFPELLVSFQGESTDWVE